MATLTVKDIAEGSSISFRSKNASDTTDWVGTLEIPVGTYRAIRGYTDPRAYNAGARQVDPTIPSDVSQLTYFLITVDNGAEQPTMQVFAQEWIEPGSLNVLTLGNQVTLMVEDPNNNSQAILSLLASAGYKSQILPSN